MRAGPMRERVTIQRPVKTTDPEWGTGLDYANLATVWAGVKTLNGTELEKDQGVQQSVHYTIRIRYRDDVSSANRLTWKGHTFDIVSAIDPDNIGRELVIDAIEHVQVAP